MRRSFDAVSPALDSLIARFGGLLRQIGFTHGLSEADVDEVIQDVRIRLWKALSEPEKIREVNASYMYRTAASASLDFIRRRRSRRETPFELRLETQEVGVDQSHGPDRQLEQTELAQQVFEAVEALAEARRPVVKMHLAGYHRLEIAELLGWSEAKTRNLLYRGLADLRETLTERGVALEHL